MSSPRQILCPIDFSPLSERSLKLAIEVCRRLGARLVLEHNLETPPPTGLAVGWMWSEEHEAKGKDEGARAVRRLEQVFERIPDDVDYEAKITRGPLDEGILHLARSLPAEMIVMGTHGPSNARHQSVTEKTIMRAPCPVLSTGERYDPGAVFGLADGPEPQELSFLIPFDFSRRSRAALDYGLETARRMPHRVHILHVAQRPPQPVEAPPMPVPVDEIASRVQGLVPDDLSDRVEVRVLVGDPVRRIVEEAARTQALFVLLAAHGKSAFKRLLFGTRTLEILHGCECPVWFLPQAALRAGA